MGASTPDERLRLIRATVLFQFLAEEGDDLGHREGETSLAETAGDVDADDVSFDIDEGGARVVCGEELVVVEDAGEFVAPF